MIIPLRNCHTVSKMIVKFQKYHVILKNDISIISLNNKYICLIYQIILKMLSQGSQILKTYKSSNQCITSIFSERKGIEDGRKALFLQDP